MQPRETENSIQSNRMITRDDFDPLAPQRTTPTPRFLGMNWLSVWANCKGLKVREGFVMQRMRVAAVSMNGLLGEPERVLAAIDGWCERAVAAKADLVLFPELVVHGHCTPKTWELAEPGPDGPSTRRLIDIARRHRLVISAGLSEKERDIVYNVQG